MSTVRTYYPKPEAVEIEKGKDESTATGNNLVINTRNEDVSVRTLVSDDPISVFTGTGNDTIIGGDSESGDDSIDAKVGNDYIDGKAGDDTIVGGAGNDTMLGGNGDDVLEIGAGDSVAGNLGSDTFRLDLSQEFDASNAPIITDFKSAEDKISLSGQGDGDLSYDMATGLLMFNGESILELDGNVALSADDLVDSTGKELPFTSVEPPVALYKLSGTVYNDTNAPDSDAIEDTDKPIAGVKVQLFAADANGKSVGAALKTATTDAKGLYGFTDLADGNYIVKETQPAGFDSVTDKDGGDPNQILAKIAGADSLGNNFLEEVTPVKPPVEPPVEPPVDGDEETTVYEFVNSSLDCYFYTVDEYEKSVIAESLDNYELQEVQPGEAIRTLTENETDSLTGAESEEVYRFFNTETGSHLYTTSEFERDSILENLDNYTLDDNMFFAYTEEVKDSIDVHRFYNATEDVHVFTHSDTEIEKMMADSENFNDEGVAFYVMPDVMS